MVLKETGNTFRILIFDVLVPGIKLGLLIWTMVLMYNTGHPWWAGSILATLLAPGTLEMIYLLGLKCFYSHEYDMIANPALVWIFMNIFTFPFTMIFRHFLQICDSKKYTKSYANLQALDTLQSFSESAPTIVLQCVILIETWRSEYDWKVVDPVVDAIHAMAEQEGFTKKTVAKICEISSIVFAVINLSKSCSRHHIFEIAGKKKKPKFMASLKGLFYFLTIIAFRLPSIVLLVLMFRQFSAFFFLALIIINVTTYSFIFPRNVAKNIWTAFSAILAPTCFVSKDDINAMSNPGFKFLIFYLVNTLAHVSMTTAAIIGAIVSFNIDQAANSNFFDQIFTFSFFEESFERIPFFYFNGNGLYPQAYLSSGLAVVLSFFQFILFCPSCLGFFE